MKTLKMLKLRIMIQRFGSAIFFFGMAFLINGLPGGRLLSIIGALLYASSRIIRAFEPIYHEPNWELVYPELSLSHNDNAAEYQKK
jgi:hypothetical protein